MELGSRAPGPIYAPGGQPVVQEGPRFSHSQWADQPAPGAAQFTAFHPKSPPPQPLTTASSFGLFRFSGQKNSVMVVTLWACGGKLALRPRPAQGTSQCRVLSPEDDSPLPGRDSHTWFLSLCLLMGKLRLRKMNTPTQLKW